MRMKHSYNKRRAPRTLKENVRLRGKKCKCGQEEKVVIFIGCT